MTLTAQQAGEVALAAVPEAERRQAAVYIDPRIHPAGATVAAGRDRLTVGGPTVVVFVDLLPTANWAHPCRYLLVDTETGAVQSVIGQFPPPAEGLRLLHRGPDVADWMLLAREPL